MEAQPFVWRKFFVAFKKDFMPYSLKEERVREFEQLR